MNQNCYLKPGCLYLYFSIVECEMETKINLDLRGGVPLKNTNFIFSESPYSTYIAHL